MLFERSAVGDVATLAVMRCGVMLALAAAGCGRVWFDPLDGGECPTGYVAAGTSCYRPVLNTSPEPTWLEGELLCEADGVGAHLVVIDDAAEAGVVGLLVPETVFDHAIGVTDLAAEGEFRTVTDLPLAYLAWGDGEPDGGTAQNCVAFQNDLSIHDADCAGPDDIVCEYDGIPAVPAAYGQ
jgi:hypothetical protein